MKLRTFSVTNLHGYISGVISFNESITFLTGANGSGKTSILKLIEKLLAPSISGLAQTKFSHACLEIEISATRIVKIVASNTHCLQIYFNDAPDDKFIFDSIDQDEWKIISEDPDRLADYSERLQVKHAKNQVIERISNIPAPAILGTDRQNQIIDYQEYDSWDSFSPSKSRSLRNARRLMNADLSSTLSDTKSMVKQAFRAARKKEQAVSSSLAKDIVSSSFFYVDIASLSQSFDFISEGKRHEILAKKEQITNSLESSSLLDSNIKKEIDAFFFKLENIFSELPREMTDSFAKQNPQIFSEWIFNRAQIDRLLKLTKRIEEKNERISFLYSSLNRFTSLVNFFFSDSNKTLGIDPLGNLYFSLSGNNEPRPIDQLSSGEKQILIIFSHALFNSYTSQSRILIVDEPELSMHLGWQESLVSKLLEGCKDMQVILATHSPEIVGEYSQFATVIKK